MSRQLTRLALRLSRCAPLEAAYSQCSSSRAAETIMCTASSGLAQSHASTSQPWWHVAGGAASAPRGFATQAAGRPAPPDEQVQLSDTAVQRLLELQRSSDEPVVLRLTVEGGGCSGFQYEFSLDGTVKEGDRVFEREGATVVMDDVSFEFLKGAIVDFESDLMRSAFVVQNNPNAASSCGCGSSFVAK